MFNILIIFLFLIRVFKSQNNENISYQTVNDKFSYMQYVKDEEVFNIYLGNELIFINFKQSNKVKFNNESISFYDFDENNKTNLSITFKIKNTRIVFIADDEFVLINEHNMTKLYLRNGENIKINSTILNGTANIFNLLSADNEYFFVEFFILSNFLVLLGIFIILYGSFHFRFGLVIHIFFFIYFIVGDIISFFVVFKFYIYYFIFFCVILGISSLKFLNSNNKNDKKLQIVNSIYGAIFGFIIFKTLIYYYIFFEFPIGFVGKNIRILLYILFLIIFITLGIVLSYFLKFDKYRFHEYHRYLYCSAVTGSFYITKGLQYVLGGYFSSILFIKENLKFINIKYNILLNYSLTYFFIQIALIIFSIIYQINYIKYKATVIIEKGMVVDPFLARESDISKSFIDNSKEEGESLRWNKNSEYISSNEIEENELIDQDD